MNWVGGARNRIKLKHEKKIQKEFFERKRHSKKVLRAKQEDCQENKGKIGISQDLIALQAIVSAHDKPKRKLREVRRPQAIDLDEAKRSDHPRRKYFVELPESPGHHKPSTLDLCSTIRESSHAQKKHQNDSQTCSKHHDIGENILKHEAFHDGQKRPLLPRKETLSIPHIQAWANNPMKESPFREPSSVREKPKPNVISINRKPVVQEFQNLSWNQKQQSAKIFKDDKEKGCADFYCTPIKQRRTIKGKFLCFDDIGFPKRSTGGDSPESTLEPQVCPFVPFSEPGPLSKFNVIKPKDKLEPEKKTFHETFDIISADTTQLLNTCKKTADLYTESKPTQLETPVQTWTARKTNIDLKGSHWSHFQIQPGQPPRKNPFFDKEAQMEDNAADSEPKENDSSIQDNEKNAKLTDGKIQAVKWNPFNLSYPVTIESGSEGADSLPGCGQEAAWRTFLKGSKRLSSERLQSIVPNQHIDHLPNLGVSLKKEEVPKKALSPGQVPDTKFGNSKITNDSFTPESEVHEPLHHEALKEVMDLERDDQSSEQTSSWSSTLTDETEGKRLEEFDYETNNFISSENSLIRSDNIEKWQSMESMSSTMKASCQLQDVTSNVFCQVKISDNQIKELLVRKDLNQVTKSPTALLKCRENIDFFNEIEDTKTDSKHDLGHEEANESYSDKVESVGNEKRSLQCRHDKKETQAIENLEKRLALTEQVAIGLEKGTQTKIESLLMTKQRHAVAQTTEQGTQTESNLFCSTSRCEAKTTQTENDKGLDNTKQERASALKHNGVRAPPIQIIDACARRNDVNRNPEHLFAKQPKEGSTKEEVSKTHKRFVRKPSSLHVIPNNMQRGSVSDKDELLSNQRNTNWYLSLLINVLTCDVDCYNFNGQK